METMKTNQLQTVQLGSFGSFKIHHLTHMGDAHKIMEIGNEIRVKRGLKPIKLSTILRKQNFWEFAVSYYNDKMQDELEEFEYCCAESALLKKEGNFRSVESTLLKKEGNFRSAESALLKKEGKYCYAESSEQYLNPFMRINYDNYKDRYGNIQYKELSKKFPKLIQVKRGGKGKSDTTYMNIYLLLKLATKLDTDLEVQIFKIFIEGKILLQRDQGGVNFKKLNILIDTLPDRIKRAKEKGQTIVESNKYFYVDTARRMNAKINGSFDKGWNDAKKDLARQTNRVELEKMLCNAIKLKFITNKETLRETIKNFEFTN